MIKVSGVDNNNELLYPSLANAWKIKHGGRMFPGAFSRDEMRSLLKILDAMRIKAEMKLRPAGSFPYIVIFDTIEPESEYWCSDIGAIEHHISEIFGIRGWKRWHKLWKRYW